MAALPSHSRPGMAATSTRSASARTASVPPRPTSAAANPPRAPAAARFTSYDGESVSWADAMAAISAKYNRRPAAGDGQPSAHTVRHAAPPVVSSAWEPTYATGRRTAAWRAATSGAWAVKPRASDAVRVRTTASSATAATANSPAHRPTAVSVAMRAAAPAAAAHADTIDADRSAPAAADAARSSRPADGATTGAAPPAAAVRERMKRAVATRVGTPTPDLADRTTTPTKSLALPSVTSGTRRSRASMTSDAEEAAADTRAASKLSPSSTWNCA
ncbi:hypothetical protein BU14_1453s0001 [Porphyra umbilicalis]|uniref:Uncharacterized protein n=1 Tax=Porphyra umbilicalis TaxID=2786 RepID=A0A1X6NLR2_PORUM|nr:hypothetical protein BU14_1453s0001 [Porphyra umbilicalis]|eukprot:OSX69502.1 hypothetical protein BU14_1453s0001 [Porphyra umbilicalis]